MGCHASRTCAGYPLVSASLSVEPLLEDLGLLDPLGIDWVIVGGESGPAARRMREEWALSVRDRCRAVGVAFTFGNGAPGDRTESCRDKKANGRLLAGGCGMSGRSWQVLLD